ncbi:MAG: ABC transporter permease, partial [Acidobacteria bacterium]|nr:ABC transporter permease [Acidobacteriota bacterium]
MQTFLQDLRYGIRMLAKSPGFTAVAVLTLALGIGANTAIFSVVKAVLLNALPYRQPERLVTLAEADKDTLNPTNTSYGTFVEWRARSRSFEKMALFRGWSATLAGVGEPEQLRGMRVSSGFFDVLGVKPLEGREFLPEEDRPDRRYVVMLSHGFWQRRFGGDPGVVGKRITLDEVPFTIVGVLPAEFRPLLFSAWSQPPDLWAVLGYDASLPYACRTCQHLQAVARLKAGVTIGQATAEMKAVDQSLVREYPTDYPADAYVIITPVRDRVVGNVDKALWILLGAVGFLLLIACANVANLLLARATARRKEVALRAALGAGRMRIARQLLTESLLVALLGGAGGVLAAMWSTSALTTLGPKQIPRLDEITVDASVLLFALGASVLTGVLFGLAPAFQASRVDLNKALKDAGRGSDGASRHDLRGLLVVGEMALAFVLVVGAGLLVKSFARLLQVDPGFDPKRVLTLNISLAGSKYRENPAAVARFYEQSLEGVRALAGVEAAGVTTALPISGGYDRAGFIVQDRLLPDPEVPSVDRYIVSPGYFRALRIPLKRGRLFTEQDRADSLPVALVGEALARQQWPGEDALGKRIQLGGRDEKKPWYTVVGIVGDVRQYSLDNPPTMQAY